MSKNTVADWDATAANNSDIAGINIAENCPAGGINNAIRAMMAQIATYVATLATSFLSASGGAMTGNLTDMGSGSTIKDPGGTARKVGYRNLPIRYATSQQTFALADMAECAAVTTGGWIIPAFATVAFQPGDLLFGYNDSGSSQTCTGAVGVTLRLEGSASTGARTIPQRAFFAAKNIRADEWAVSGVGVS